MKQNTCSVVVDVKVMLLYLLCFNTFTWWFSLAPWFWQIIAITGAIELFFLCVYNTINCYKGL